MKKSKLFSLIAATLFVGSAMAQTVTYSYTVSTAISKDTRTATTGGFITFGADKFETQNSVLAYKMDGDISATSTKYVLVEPTAALQEGDVIKIGGFCTSSPGSAGFGIFEKRANGETAIATHTLTAKNTTEYLTYTVTATDAIVGKNQFYIFRSVASSYFLSVEIISAPSVLDDATLKSITVNGEELEKFDPATTAYDVELPYGTTDIPVVAATATSSKATVAVTQATAVTGTASILVTAEDNTTTKTYTVSFTVAESQSTDATLASISIDGVAIADFKADSLNYTHAIAYTAAAIPVITAEANDESADVAITQAEAVPGTATIVVTAQAGNTQTYTVAISRADAIKHLTVVPFTNGAKGAIDEANLTVTVPYMAGEAVPTVDGENIAVSGDGTPVATLNEDGTITLKGADNVEAVYTVVTKRLAPETLTAEVITFTGEEAYIFAPYGWDASKGVKFAKNVNDEGNMRDAKGNTRIYMALPPADSVRLTSGSSGARAVVITVNGVSSTVTETAASGSTITITLNKDANNFVAIESNQTKGDGGFTMMQLFNPSDPISTALDQTQVEAKAVKVIRNGQLLIIREGKTYTAQGVELQ